MKYFNKVLRKREKLVDQYIRLTTRPYHTKLPFRNEHLVLWDINRQLYELIPVYVKRRKMRRIRLPVEYHYYDVKHPVLR